MINVYNFEDKTAEDCRMKCLEELDVYNNEILTKRQHSLLIKIVKSYNIESRRGEVNE